MFACFKYSTNESLYFVQHVFCNYAEDVDRGILQAAECLGPAVSARKCAGALYALATTEMEEFHVSFQ